MTRARVARPLLATALCAAAAAAFFAPTFQRSQPAGGPDYLPTSNSLAAPPFLAGTGAGFSLSVAEAAPVSTNTSNQIYFSQTGHFVRDAFLNYWLMDGGMALYGYPISEEMQDGGKTVQYFERARFEYNPSSGNPWHVDLSPAGSLLTRDRGFAAAPASTSADSIYFQDTGHNLGGAFHQFWDASGGQSRFGMPISEQMQENGKTVQYFQNARFEMAGQGKVQLGSVGAELLAANIAQSGTRQNAAPQDRPGFEMSFQGDATWFNADWEHVISLNKGWGNLPSSYEGRGLYAAAPADLGLYGRWARVTRGSRSVFVQFIDVIDWKDIPAVRSRGVVIDLGKEAFNALGGVDGPHYRVSFDVLWPGDEP